ncbi:hypothetical protein F7725_013563 [Dissostichus mawsoni]|uniref:Uncharacterized protein n=1 Tax=Dissostichus mawsoni TaxID=36200 RepID=A0A7J5Y488_DISMA|nr:hypothetical protein F7725_013563 [Dissostichus mawsoni]
MPSTSTSEENSDPVTVSGNVARFSMIDQHFFSVRKTPESSLPNSREQSAVTPHTDPLRRLWLYHTPGC